MKTAQGSIKLDTSSFDKAIDTSKEKLASLASMIKKLITAILAIVAAYKVFSDLKEKILMVATAVKYLDRIFSQSGNIATTVFSDIKSAVLENVSSMTDAFKSLKDYASKAFETIKTKNASLPPVLNNTNSKFKDTISLIGTLAGGAVLMRTTFGLMGGAISVVGTIISKAFSGVVDVFKMVANFVKSALVGAFNILVGVMKGVAVGAIAVGTAIATITAVIARGVIGVFQMGDELKRFRDITGASIPFLMSLQNQFKQNGMAADDMIPVLSEMNRSISQIDAKGQPSNQALKQMGVNLKELQPLSTDDRFKKLGMSLSTIADRGLRAQYSMDIFGKHGRNVLAILSDQSALANLGKNLDASSKTMVEQADRFARISAKLKDTGTTFRGFFTQIAGGVAPQLETILDMFSKGDIFTPLGTMLGEKLSYGLDVFVGAIQKGKVMEALKNSLIIPIIYFNSYFERSLSTIQKAIKIISAPRDLTVLFTNIPAKSMLGSLGASLAETFLRIAKLFGVAILEGLQYPLAAIQVAFNNIAINFAIMLTKGIINAFGSLAKVNPILKQLGFGNLGDVMGSLFEKISGGGGAKKSILDQIKEQVAQNKATGVLDFGQGTMQDAIEKVSFSLKDTLSNATDIVNTFISQFQNMEGMSDADRKKLDDYKKFFEELQKVGADFVKKSEPLPVTQPFTPKVEPLKTSMAQEAVSSLQRIGGGGGAFTGYDPLLKNAEKQTMLQEKIALEIEKQNKRAEKGGGLYDSLLMGVGARFAA